MYNGCGISVGGNDPYNPLGLPPYTIRLQYADGVTPTFSSGTAVQVASSPNVWDLTYNNTNWASLLYGQAQLLSVLGANSSGVLNMTNMFRGCTSLTTVPLFDTSSVTNMTSMLSGCTSLTSVPLFNTGNVTYVDFTFYECTAVQSGALAMYQQMASQATPPMSYIYCFTNCGSNTTTGAAELAQIPSSWGGNGLG
jgi:surface protein